MSDSVQWPVLTLNQPVGTFYLAKAPASELLRICRFDYRQLVRQEGRADFVGIQRELSGRRISEIQRYLSTRDATFPTSIVLAVDERCVSVEGGTMSIFSYEDETDPTMTISLDQVATIIDGQHRLKAFEGSGIDFDLSVSVFIGIDEATEAEIFSTVNLAQTKVNKSLVYDLFSLSEKPSPEKTCHEITVAMDQIQGSPFQGRIKRLGTATAGRFGETLSQATVVKGMLPYLTRDPLKDRDIGKRFGFWDPVLARDASKQIFAPLFRNREDEKILAIMLNYFGAIAERWPDAWASSGRGIMIARTNGYNGFMRFLRHAYLSQTTTFQVVPKTSFLRILQRVKLTDAEFSTEAFVPGTSGATRLYHKLVRDSGLEGI